MIVQEQEMMDAPAHPLTRSPAQVGSRRWSTAALGLIIVAYLALATLYSVMVPLGEGPDEPGHAGYVFFLARENRLPVQRFDPGQSDVPGEGHQPPLAYLLASAAVRLLPGEARAPDVIGNPRFVWNGGDQVNALVHGSREYWPWQGSTLAWHLARLVSVGLGAATVALTYFIASNLRFAICDLRFAHADMPEGNRTSKIQNGKSMPILAAALVAFNPQFLFTMALVTNDALLVTLSALLLWLIVTTDDRRPTTDDGQQIRSGVNGGYRAIIRSLAIGIVLGLALITKQSAMLLIPIALLGVVRRHRVAPRFKTIWRHFASLSPCHLVILSSTLVAGWWYVRNRRLYGDPLGLTAFRAEFATQSFDFGSVTAWRGALAQLHDSFWARFGWMNLAPPAWVIALFVAIEVVALLGYGMLAVRHWRTWRFDLHALVTSNMFVLVLLLVLTLAWIISFVRTAGLVAWQGRFLFPALPAIAVLLARGLVVWKNKEQSMKNIGLRQISLFFMLCSLFLIALWLPFSVIGPAYANETLPAQQAQATLGTPVYARFSDGREKGIELRGWQVTGDATPGGTLQITLTWQALGRASRDWQVFVQLTNAQDQIVASAEAPAKSAAFPMTEWTTGDWVQGQYTLQLPPELAPGTYTLSVGLFDPQSDGRRNRVYDQKGKRVGDTVNLGTITVSQK